MPTRSTLSAGVTMMLARRAIIVWSHHWLNDATQEASETIGTFYVHWDPPALWEPHDR